MAVGCAVVDGVEFVRKDNVNGFVYVHWYAQMSGKPVSGTAWYDTQFCGGVAQRTCCFVYCSVAANSNYSVVAVGCGCFCKVVCVVRALGEPYGYVVTVKPLLKDFRQIVFFAVS